MITPEQTAKLTALRRLKVLKENNGLAFYKPHEKQELFHAAGSFKRRYLRTGNRFGKSTCGAAEDCAWALGQRIWYPVGHPNRTLGIPSRSTKGLIIVADWDKAREIYTNREKGAAQGKIFRLLPASAIQSIHKSQAGEIDCISIESVHGGTSSIYIDTIKSFMANPMGQESSDWDWIHVDEPCPKKMWEANARGLMDRDGSAWFTCTPISEQWINELFIPRSRLREDFEEGCAPTSESKWVLTGSSFDNTSVPREGIERFTNDLSADVRAARLYGRPTTMAGVVYSEFEQARHVYHDLPIGWKDFDCPPDNYTIRVAIDPHPKTPHAVLFAATAPTGQTFFYREFFQHVLLDDLCDAILEILGGRIPHSVICDPIAFNADPISGAQWADSFYRRGLNVIPAPKELTYGITATKQALAHTDSNSLFFSSALSETLYEFDTYIWDTKKENKPRDADDHMMECLYRLVISGLDYVDPVADNAFNPNHIIPFSGDKSIPRFADTREWMKNVA